MAPKPKRWHDMKNCLSEQAGQIQYVFHVELIIRAEDINCEEVETGIDHIREQAAFDFVLAEILKPDDPRRI